MANSYEKFILGFRKEKIAHQDANHAFYYIIPAGLVKLIRAEQIKLFNFDTPLNKIIKYNFKKRGVDVGVSISNKHRPTNTKYNYAQVDCNLAKFKSIPMKVQSGIEDYMIEINHVSVCARKPNAPEYGGYTLIDARPDKGEANVRHIGGAATVNPNMLNQTFEKLGFKTITYLLDSR